MDKYFITGSTGFMGSHLLKRLRGDKYLYSRGQDVSVVAEYKPDYIIHLAGEIYNNSEMVDSNILLTHHLLEQAKNLPKLKAMIVIGSSSEYGRKDHPMSEKDFLDPTTIYEATKGAATLLCQAYARTYTVPVMVVRPFSVYGLYEPKHRFIPTIIRNLRKRLPIRIAPGAHDFIHVDDFIDGILQVLSHPQAGEIYNFGTGIQTSNQELVSIIEKVMNKSVKKRFVKKMRAFDSDCWVADISKARSIGWKPKIGLVEGLTRVIEEENVILRAKNS